MNDCMWSWVCVCDGGKCGQCKKYCSVSDSENNYILKQYNKDLEAALEPVREKWKGIMEAYAVEKIQDGTAD